MKSERVYAARSESFTSFRELTRAIQLVALARLASLSHRIKSRQKTLAVPHRLFTVCPTRSFVKKYLIIVIGTDKTCCGALNSNLFSAVRELVGRLVKGGKDVDIVPFGEKAKLFIKREYKRHWRQSFLRLDREAPSLALSAMILDRIMWKRFFDRVAVDKYIIVFNRYYNMKVQRVTAYIFYSHDILERLFTVTWFHLWKLNKFFAIFLRKRSSRSKTTSMRLSSNLWFLTCSLVSLDAMEEHQYSELGARASTMDNAYNNIQDIIDELRIVYNQVRQDTITTELNEIVSGVLFSRG